MNPKVTVDLHENDIESLEEASHQEKEEIIQKIFEQLEDEKEAELLAGFCTGERETFDGLLAVMDTTLEDDWTGVISAAFTGSAYFGCKDMDRLEEYDEVVSFEVDFENERITFETDTPDPVEREPDYY